MTNIKSRAKRLVHLSGAVFFSLALHAMGLVVAAGLVIYHFIPRSNIVFEPPASTVFPPVPLRRLQPLLPDLACSIRPDSVWETTIPSDFSSSFGHSFSAPAGVESWMKLPDLGGLDLFVGLDAVDSVIGSPCTIGNDLEGTFYDFKRNRRGQYTGAGNETYSDRMRTFLHRDWDSNVLNSFYRAPRKLYTTLIVVPPCASTTAPSAFGEGDAVGRYWMIIYRGELVYPENITFRFWGTGDEVMVVRVDQKIVLAACWDTIQDDLVGDLWRSRSVESRRYYMGNNRAVVGDWIELEAGVPRALEVLLGDNGGEACAILAVEVKGINYKHNRQGGPILPAFQTSEPSRRLLDIIYKDLPEGEICLTNGPIFRDY